MAIPLVPAIWASSAVVGVMMEIYQAWRENPNIKMAEHLRALQVEEVQRKSLEMTAEENVRGRHARLRAQRLSDLTNLKHGMDIGTIDVTWSGTPGGDAEQRDLPMLQIVAARLGMDPQDLIARYDPTRSNSYVPAQRRGNLPRPTPKQLAQADAFSAPPPTGPAQLNPMTGFGQ